MDKNKMPRQENNCRAFELCGRTIIVDDFIYRRLFKDPDIKPKRKYKFIKSFYLANGCPRMVLKAVKNKTILLSRYIMRAGRGEIVDHINRNPLDNRRCNLRIVNARQNMLNRKIKNKTGLIGVTAYLNDGNFYLRANFRANKTKRLRFNCPDTPFNRILAALAHDKFVLQAGEEEYAPLNFPQWQFEPMRSILMKEDLGKFKERTQNSEHSRQNKNKRPMNKRQKLILRFCRRMTSRKILSPQRHREN
jgi:hypothetical protein